MSKALYILLLSAVFGAAGLRAQLPMPGDSLRDSFPPLPPPAFHWHDFGVGWTDGNILFFQGYDARVLYADASSGLPIYPDWGLYSRTTVFPTFWQVGAHASAVDTVRGLKLRLSLNYSQRKDTMEYGSDFIVNDTIYGRMASEQGSFGSVSIAAMKQSRKALGFVRFYGGAQVELGLSPSSRINFYEYAFDYGDERYVEFNAFRASGKPRFTAFATAILGLETVFFKRIGFTAEVKSGLGAQFVVRERPFGMGRTNYFIGVNYYLFDYNRRPLPRPIQVPVIYPEPDQESPPTPKF